MTVRFALLGAERIGKQVVTSNSRRATYGYDQRVASGRRVPVGK